MDIEFRFASRWGVLSLDRGGFFPNSHSKWTRLLGARTEWDNGCQSTILYYTGAGRQERSKWIFFEAFIINHYWTGNAEWPNS